MKKNYNLKDINLFISKIQPRDKKNVLKIINSEKIKFLNAPGGLNKHQNWQGGYLDHLTETMFIATLLYKNLNEQRKLSFSLSDALYTLFLHDLEKIFKLTINKDGKPVKTQLCNNKKYKNASILTERFKIKLTPKQKNALLYAEGEKSDYHPAKRIMNPLAAFIHCCDTISARIWYNEPKNKGILRIYNI
jgi:hypothetical protein